THLETVISALGNRVFLLHDVHRPEPILFQTRHALSFLRGPMTRDQVAQLMEPIKKSRPSLPVADTPAGDREADQAFRAALRPTAGLTGGEPLNHVPPGLPADLPQFYLPVVGSPPAANAPLLYQPRLLAFADVVFMDKRRGVARRGRSRLRAPPPPPTGGGAN